MYLRFHVSNLFLDVRTLAFFKLQVHAFLDDKLEVTKVLESSCYGMKHFGKEELLQAFLLLPQRF